MVVKNAETGAASSFTVAALREEEEEAERELHWRLKNVAESCWRRQKRERQAELAKNLGRSRKNPETAARSAGRPALFFFLHPIQCGGTQTNSGEGREKRRRGKRVYSQEGFPLLCSTLHLTSNTITSTYYSTYLYAAPGS